MKKLFVYLTVPAFFFASCVGNPDGEKAETSDAADVAAGEGTELTINPDSSSVAWLGNKVTGQHNGEVKIKSGTVTVDDGKLTGGTIVIDLATLESHDLEGEFKGKLETHLKSGDFFDVENHPEATLEITDVNVDAATGEATVAANLTIRGITKNITFKAVIAEATDNAFVADADFNIERTQWDVNYTGKADDLISKEINFKVRLVASR